MDSALPVLMEKTKVFDSFGDQIPQLKAFTDSKKVNSGLPIAGALAVSSLLLLLIKGLCVFVVLGTVIYPTYRSISVILGDKHEETKIWLSYWILYAAIHLMDSMFGGILYYVPLRWWIEQAFFAYLLAPQTDGIRMFYNKYFMPTLLQHKDQINEFAEQTGKIAKQAEGDVKVVLEKGAEKADDLKKAVDTKMAANTDGSHPEQVMVEATN